jgi:hypothetical protein
MATPSDYQSVANFDPEEGQEKCEYFWPNEKQNGTKRLSKENSKRRGWHY